MPDPVTLAAYGLPGLFLAALLAGSVVPFPSEPVLLGLLAGGVEPAAGVIVATAGNSLGALTLLLMGRAAAAGARGAAARWAHRQVQAESRRIERASEQVGRWGPPALLLSWVPILGDALVLAAGLLGAPLARSMLYVTVGKAVRFGVVTWLALLASGAAG